MMRLSYASEQDPLVQQWIIRWIERLTGSRGLQEVYENLPDLPSHLLWAAALESLDIRIRIGGEGIGAVPREGPLVMLANHPFGIVDGLALCAIAAQVRPDFKVLTHSILCHDDRVRDNLLPVDFSETPEAQRTNIETRRLANETLAAGGTIVMFPAGAVSTAPGGLGRAVDGQWKTFVAKLVRSSRSTVVPVFFEGQNARLFHLASQLSTTLRLALLLREVGRRRGTEIGVRIGQSLPFADLAVIEGRENLTRHLRSAVLALGAAGPGTAELGEVPVVDRRLE